MKNKDPVYLTKKRPEVLQHYPTEKSCTLPSLPNGK